MQMKVVVVSLAVLVGTTANATENVRAVALEPLLRKPVAAAFLSNDSVLCLGKPRDWGRYWRCMRRHMNRCLKNG